MLDARLQRHEYNIEKLTSVQFNTVEFCVQLRASSQYWGSRGELAYVFAMQPCDMTS